MAGLCIIFEFTVDRSNDLHVSSIPTADEHTVYTASIIRNVLYKYSAPGLVKVIEPRWTDAANFRGCPGLGENLITGLIGPGPGKNRQQARHYCQNSSGASTITGCISRFSLIKNLHLSAVKRPKHSLCE